MRTPLAAMLLALGTITACARAPEGPAQGGVLRERLGTPPTQWHLPQGLREISGLALDAQQRLFAIDDEQAVIYQIDYENGGVRKRFAVGSPPLRGDFEGLAAVGDGLYALTSDGLLLRFPVGEDGATVRGEQRHTGLADTCEFEGLAHEPTHNSLLLACKRVLLRGHKREVRVIRWPLGHTREAARAFTVDEDVLAQAVGAQDFQPSAIALDRTDGSLWLLAARQRAVARVRLGPEGSLTPLDATGLPFAALHRQSEGLALIGDEKIMIADEGGKQRGRLARYGKR